MPSYPPQLNLGAFVPTTNIWDPSELYTLDIQPEFRELLVRLYQNLNNMSLLLNLKDTGYYTLEEFLNSQAFFPIQLFLQQHRKRQFLDRDLENLYKWEHFPIMELFPLPMALQFKIPIHLPEYTERQVIKLALILYRCPTHHPRWPII